MSIILLALAIAAAPPTTRTASTPQAFQLVYRDALNAQDAAAARSLFLIRTPGEAAMVDVFIANELDTAKLADAAGKAFGIKLVGGGTLAPPVEIDQWRMQGDLALFGKRDTGKPAYPPLRKSADGFKIDLVAWGMDWMDKPDAAEARKRHRPNPDPSAPAMRALKEGTFRTIDEFRDEYGEATLATAPNSPRGNPPRPFRRPVKLDLSSPKAAIRSHALAIAEGDGDAFLRSIQIVDPADEAQSKALARRITSWASLQEAACRKFGIDGTRVGVEVEIPPPRRESLALLLEREEFELSVNGDKAQLKENDDVLSELARIKEEWKVCSRPSDQIGQKDDDPNDWPHIFNLVSQLEEAFAKRINAGEFPSADAAQAAIRAASKAPPAAPQ